MSKKNWIKGAIKRPGALRAAAKKRGRSISEMIAHPPPKASARLKRQIALARTLMKLRAKRRRP